MNTQQADEFLREYGRELTSVGDGVKGWTVVSSEFVGSKHAETTHAVVAVDPDGGAWQFFIGQEYYEGTRYVEGSAVPVTAVVETKKVVTYVARAMRKSNGD